MTSWLRQIDELLRGIKTAPDRLSRDRGDLPLSAFVPLAIVFGAGYGFFMGWYALIIRDTPGYTRAR